MDTVNKKIPDSLPHGIKGLLEYTWSLPLWSYILLGIILTLLVCFFLFKLWKNYQNKKTFALRKTPLEIFIEKLKGLNPPQPLTAIAASHYFFELSMLFREVIEMITRIPATDLTLKELRPRLREIIFLPSEKIETMIKFFERAEMIKFAEAQTDFVEAQNFHDLILTWTEELCASRRKNDEESGVKKIP